MRKLIPLLAIALVIWIFFFHRSVPGIGRKSGRKVRQVGQVGQELIDGEEIPGSPLARYEHEAGKALTARVLVENPLAADLRLQERILQMGRRLAAAASRSEVRFRFAVLEGAEPRSLAIPGGSIFLSRGFIERIGGDEDLLACLLGHEIAHIDCRHASRGLAARALTRAGMRFLPLLRNVFVSRVSGDLESRILDGYARDYEFEADRAGIRLAQRAGYDSGALARFLRRCHEHPDPQLDASSYFRSHPPPLERLRALEG
jgi:predicted Zn-dependent protease